MNKQYYIYIMSNYDRNVLYIGVTNNLVRRVYEHKQGMIDGFTKKYKCKYLVFYENTNSIESAILREKQLKNWSRPKKDRLIVRLNPDLQDLYDRII